VAATFADIADALAGVSVDRTAPARA
jgi:hypothetical protein